MCVRVPPTTSPTARLPNWPPLQHATARLQHPTSRRTTWVLPRGPFSGPALGVAGVLVGVPPQH
eukprot:13191027-Alexandrium_andersonii.AAC.1